MMYKKVALLLVVFGVISSCKKDSFSTESDPYQDEYRFYTRAKVNGLPLDLYAGEDGYGLETDYELQNGVVVMKGELSDPDSPMKNSLVLRIRSDKKIASESEFQVGTALRPGLYAYRDRTGTIVVPGEYKLDFFGDTSYYPMNYHWQFPDSTESYQQNPGSRVVNLNEHTDPYIVTLTTDYSGCESRITHKINLEEDCDATFNIKGLTSYDCKVEVVSRVGNILAVSWMLDGQSVSPDFSGNIGSAYLAGSHKLQADIEFESGCSKTVIREFDGSSSMHCFTDFWYNKTHVTTYDEDQLGTIELEYYDETGKMYSTFYAGVEGDFKIASLTPYRENDVGQKTTRFFFEADAILKSSDGASVELTECFGSFAVAHP